MVWHGGNLLGEHLAGVAFKFLCADPWRPRVRGLGVPVRFWTSAPNPLSPGRDDPPPAVDLERAERNIVVLLVDAWLMSGGWGDYVSDLVGMVSTSSRHWLLPVLLTRKVDRTSSISDMNCLRLYETDLELRDQVFVNKILHRLFRHVTDDDSPLTVLLSHASTDGRGVALAVRKYLHDYTDIGDFLDVHSIAAGERLVEAIDRAISASTFLAIVTDSYSSRGWCRHEVVKAKRELGPIVLLDAVEDGDERRSPYLGNIPTLRWKPDSPLVMERLLGLLLAESFRHRYFPRQVAWLSRLQRVDLPYYCLSRPPEPLTLLELRRRTGSVEADLTVVYPDPPLDAEETRLLHEFEPRMRLMTPTMLFSA
ncbi:toll/interleukin-1 receptor domain-containing protein [Protofrankia symbiont of Coriaria ruscifolia]|uniref:toll/interleukin-1 receptor domain-containing protein n=1 Tax=Protofrankia symbiont of Coriaria ruscifolia TaxID=1306542 RepID=UPI0010418764|nr:toll/interleukin-1 receptor domain-containing protein [Protofrankia symbiont of Coriaria ruscifolia]